MTPLAAVHSVLSTSTPTEDDLYSARAGFCASLTGLLAALYTEEGKGSDYDKELEKLSSFYNTVEFLPLLFLGFYCTSEMARLFALMGDISTLSGLCVDFSLTLASNYMPPVRAATPHLPGLPTKVHPFTQLALCASVFGGAVAGIPISSLLLFDLNKI